MSFVADVGGTNIRLALVENAKIVKIEKFLCADFDTIKDAVMHFQNRNNVESFEAGSIGIACPINGDLVTMTNHSWAFSQKELKEALALTSLFVINDFTAVAHSLPSLHQDQVIQMGTGKAKEHANIAVFGPGTGLGVEHLTWTQQGWQTLDGEGGHVDFAPVDDVDIIIWQYLQNKHGRASAEEVLSGRGIVNIYTALCLHHKREVTLNTPAQITQAGLDKSDDLAELTIQQFCRVMGSFAGNLALNLCARGGVFIGGGIISHLGDYLLQSDFRARFEAKGDFENYVKDIPTYLINEPDHGLLGALAYLTQHTQRKNDE
jgi:glucokinase